MKIIILIIFLFLSIFNANAQTKVVEPLSWKGMTIDVSSPEDVIGKFGKPEKEEMDRLDILYTKGKVFTQNANKKDWRVLKYKEIDQATNVRFGFNKNNKLIYIKFSPSLKDSKKLIDAQAFLRAYENTNFTPKESLLGQYILLGKHQSGYILGEISRGAAGILERKSVFDTKTIEDESNDNLTGTVITVQFLSKSLENNDNIDILK